MSFEEAPPVYVGLDWTAEIHAVSTLDHTGKQLASFTIEHGAERIRRLIGRLAKYGDPADVQVGVERPNGQQLDLLLEPGLAAGELVSFEGQAPGLQGGGDPFGELMCATGRDRAGRDMAHPRKAARLHGPGVLDERQVGAQPLDLPENMARQQDRAPTVRGFGDAIAEDLFHERVQAAGWLVQEQQLHRRGQCADQCDLLPVAFAVRAHLLANIEREAVPPAPAQPRGRGCRAGQPARRGPALR